MLDSYFVHMSIQPVVPAIVGVRGRIGLAQREGMNVLSRFFHFGVGPEHDEKVGKGRREDWNEEASHVVIAKFGQTEWEVGEPGELGQGVINALVKPSSPPQTRGREMARAGNEGAGGVRRFKRPPSLTAANLPCSCVRRAGRPGCEGMSRAAKPWAKGASQTPATQIDDLGSTWEARARSIDAAARSRMQTSSIDSILVVGRMWSGILGLAGPPKREERELIHPPIISQGPTWV